MQQQRAAHTSTEHYNIIFGGNVVHDGRRGGGLRYTTEVREDQRIIERKRKEEEGERESRGMR